MEQNVINFSHNWNGKLQNKCFTTIRLHNPRKYQIGKIYEVRLKETIIKECEIIAIKETVIANMGEIVCHLDTGYSRFETMKILHKMYPFLNEKPHTIFSIILFKTIKK